MMSNGNDWRIKVAYLGLLGTIFSWSLIPIFQKQLLSVLSPIEVTFSRFFLTSVILIIWVVVKKRQELLLMIKEDFLILMLSTILGPLLAMVLFNYGILLIPIGIASMLIAFEPVFTYIFAVFAKQEEWNVKRMLSIIIALIGLFLVVYSDSGEKSFWMGFVIIVFSTMIWAINTILTKKLVHKYHPVVMIAYSFLISSIVLIPLLGNQYIENIAKLDYSLWFNLLFCVIPGTVFGFSMWYLCLKFVAPSSVSISLYLIPILSFVGGVVLLNEGVTFIKVLGMIVTLYGLYLVNIKLRNQTADGVLTRGTQGKSHCSCQEMS
jgi:drug/metabolite transporter (DMT)-like permease